VTNHGPDPSSGSTVTDNLPSGITNAGTQTPGCSISGQTVTCQVVPLANGDSTAIGITADSSQTPGTCVQNQASVDGIEDDPVSTNDNSSLTTCTRNSDLALAKSASALVVSPGGQISWTLTVTNHGPDDSPGSAVSDTLPSAVTNTATSTPGCNVLGAQGSQVVNCAVGPLAANASTPITITADAPQTPSTCVDNTGSVDGGAADPNASNDDASARTCTSPAADLALTKSGPATVDPTGQITWTLTVTNNGPDQSSGSTVTDNLPAGVTNAASQTPGCTVQGSVVSCDLGTLDSGDSTNVVITANAPATQSICFDNQATVEGNEGDPVLGNETGTAHTCTNAPKTEGQTGTAPKLVVTKRTAAKTPSPGAVIGYHITVKNIGGSDANNVTVCDQLPSEETLVRAAGAKVTGQKVCWTIDHLAPGESKKFGILVHIKDSASGAVRNRAFARAANAEKAKAAAKVRVSPIAGGCPSFRGVAPEIRPYC
jgi:uncharacterized repeat protein (TIGR01451 family)